MSSFSYPKITVITICYNCFKGFLDTVMSVRHQNYMNVEHVVIDGGSVDETPAYLTENKELFSYSVSEPDSGIYHAMNKGLEHVTGEWVIYLNAGDVFISDTILNEMVAEYLCKYSEGICTGKVNLYKNGVSLNMTHPRGGGDKENLLLGNCIAHQASFIHHTVFNRVGNWAEHFKINGDYDFWIRAKKYGISFHHNEIALANFDYDGISSQRNNYILSLKEQLSILLYYQYLSVVDACFQYVKKSLMYHVKTLVRFLLGLK